MSAEVLDKIDKKYSLIKLLIVLALSMVSLTILTKYLFIWFPKMHSTNMPVICLGLLILFISPTIYMYFYRPIIRQFESLKNAEEKMRKLALNDMLTGLYNRRGFMTFADQLLKLSKREQRGLTVIYADLDNLKRINDDYGHEEGDRALISIANVLKETFRGSDVIGRLGGDEFAILALEAKEESVDTLRKRLKENLERVNYMFPLHKLTFSLGITYFNPKKPQTVEELLRKSDMLMYVEKGISEGRNFNKEVRETLHI